MNMTQSRFFCTECGKEGLGINRPKGHQRECGHLKKLYCIFCQKEVNHVEIKEMGNYTIEDFKLEYELGRFINGQRESLADCTCQKCKYNINGKCWNSKRDFKCKHRRW